MRQPLANTSLIINELLTYSIWVSCIDCFAKQFPGILGFWYFSFWIKAWLVELLFDSRLNNNIVQTTCIWVQRDWLVDFISDPRQMIYSKGHDSCVNSVMLDALCCAKKSSLNLHNVHISKPNAKLHILKRTTQMSICQRYSTWPHSIERKNSVPTSRHVTERAMRPGGRKWPEYERKEVYWAIIAE